MWTTLCPAKEQHLPPALPQMGSDDVQRRYGGMNDENREAGWYPFTAGNRYNLYSDSLWKRSLTWPLFTHRKDQDE